MDIEKAKAAVAARFGPVETLVEERAGYCAGLVSPPTGMNWDFSDKAQVRTMYEIFGIRRGIVPNVEGDFSGRIAHDGEPFVMTALDGTRSIARFTYACEGDFLGAAGQALTGTLGGCMNVVACGRDRNGIMHMTASHAGFRSLVDIGMLEGKPPREFDGIIESIADGFWRRFKIPHEAIELECFFGLEPGALVYNYDEGDGEVRRRYLDLIVPTCGPAAAWETVNERGTAVVVDPGEIALAKARRMGFKSAKRSCDIPQHGPFANTRHKVAPLAGKRRNWAAIIRTT